MCIPRKAPVRSFEKGRRKIGERDRSRIRKIVISDPYLYRVREWIFNNKLLEHQMYLNATI